MMRSMTNRSLCVLALLFACVLPACGWLNLHGTTGLLSPAADQTAGNGNKVVILVIDGLRYSESFGDPTAAHIPRLAAVLRSQGTLFENFRNEGITATNPGHTSMLTGTWQDIANDGSERPDKPTIFEYFREHYSAPANDAWIVSGKAKLNICSYSTDSGYGPGYGATESVNFESDAAVVDAALSVLHDAHPALLAANLPAVDFAGHDGDWERYVSAIETVDSLVLEVWLALQNDGFYAGSTYLFITNDHGRHDDAHGGFREHGCSCEGCEHIMLLVVGPDVVPNHTVTHTYTLRDVCTTVGEILECPTPKSEGVEIAEMFVGGSARIPDRRP